MPITKTIKLFEYAELSESAKETARNWYLDCQDSSDLEYVVEDFARVCELFGIDLDTQAVRLMGGGTRQEPSVSWDASYGGMASFSGYYRYKKGAAKAVKAYTGGSDSELHRIALALQEVQARNFYGITARIKDSSRYGMEVDCEFTDLAGSWRDGSYEDCDAIKEAFKDLAAWFQKQLCAESEYQSSREYIEEAMEGNGYTFREDGTRED